MSDPTPSAALAGILERHEQLRTRYGYVGGLLVLAKAKDDVPRLVAALESALTALARHQQTFTDDRGVTLCGGCLRPAPCPDTPEAITAELTAKEGSDG